MDIYVCQQIEKKKKKKKKKKRKKERSVTKKRVRPKGERDKRETKKS